MNNKEIQIREAALSDTKIIVNLVREHAAGAGETSPSSGNAFLDIFWLPDSIVMETMVIA